MKKHLILILALLLCAAGLRANPVGLAKAQKVAQAFLRGQGMAQARLTDLSGQTPFREFYTFAIDGGGFILVAADDATAPILGFSTRNNILTEGMPGHVRSWLRAYEEQIAYHREQGMAAHADWGLLEGDGDMEPRYTSVAPLLSTTWDQSPYYNNLCPYDNTYQDRTVTGCVATATAQVMKFWGHPATGYGSHSYSDNGYNGTTYGTLSANFGSTTYAWSQMPTQLTASSSTAQVNAVATLMYHIGVADEMTYGVAAIGGSGANNYSYDGQYNTPCSQNALIEYFKYAPDMNIVDRDRFSTADFTALLRADLDAGHPILYSGRDTEGGHSFVIDGYNEQGQFHVNWGWSGWWDGYFYIGALNPGSSGTGGTSSDQYNLRNVALTNIHPNTSWSTSATTTVSATATTGGTVAGGGTYSFGSVVSLSATASSGHRFASWNDGGSCASLSFKATGGSYSYLGHFESILQNDTISYCGNGNLVSGYGDPTSNTTYWGMRVPAGVGAGQELTAVQLYVRAPGSYDVYVCDGVNSFSENYIYTGTHSFSSTGWKTITLPTPHTLVATHTLWVAFSSTAAYPAAVTTYSGNAEGSLWGSSLTLLNQPYTFMIRAITGTGSGSGGGDTIVAPDNCAWHDNLLDTDQPYYIWRQDHNNSIYNYAEKFSNNESLTIDSICFAPNTVHGNGNLVVTLCPANASGAPGNALGSLTIPYSQMAEGYWNRFALATPVTVTGDYFLCFALNSSPATDTLALLSSGDRAPNTGWAKYGNTWYEMSNLYQGITGITLFAQAHACPADEPPAPTQYTITALSNNNAWGTVTGGGTYDEGTQATLVATPASGFHFVSWQDGSTQNPRTITVTANATYTATFAQNASEPATYTITANANNPAWGTVTGGGTYEEGAQVTLTATANSGYYFQRWQDGNMQNPRTITVTGNATYTAMFAKQQGIDGTEEELEVLGVEYYDLLGRRLQAEPARGVYLVRTLTTQGAHTEKIVKY